MRGIAQDVRHAARRLGRSPGFTVAVVLTLALGLGANGAMFSVVRGVLLTPLPFQEPDRLVRVLHGHRERGLEPGSFSPQDLDDLEREAKVFESLAAWWYVPGLSGMNLTGGGEPVRAEAAFVSEDFFGVLGVPAARGRVFAAEEHVPGSNVVAVLSDAFWHRRFGADPAAVGTTITVDEQPFTVVGVMPPELTYPSKQSDLWLPLSLIGDDDIPHVRSLRWLNVVGRLAPGASLEAAGARTDALVENLAGEYPESNEGWTVSEVVPLRETLVGDVRPALLVLFGAVGTVLLIACANLANLFLVRAVGLYGVIAYAVGRRTREIGVRIALGAGRGRVLVGVVGRSLALVAGGLVLGLALARLGTGLLASQLYEVRPTDPASFLVVAVVVAAPGVAAASIPARRASRVDPAEALRNQ